MPQKRILLAIGLIIVAIAAAFGLYFIFFRTPAIPVPGAETETGAPGTGLPTAGPGEPTAPGTAIPGIPSTLPVASTIAQGGPTKTTALTDAPVKGATLSGDGKSMTYYNEDDGKFYRVAPDGTITQISNQQFFNVDTITWSPDAQRAILEYPDGSNILFDFDRNVQTTLPKHWEDFDFSPNGNEIITKSIGVDRNNRWLITSQTDGSQAKIISPLGDNADRVTVSWSPNDEVVGFSDTGSAMGIDTTEIYLIGKNKENLKSLIVDGGGFTPLWSKDGNQLLYSAFDPDHGFRPTLWLTDARGDSIGANRHTIGINTWADKCVFQDNTTVYCAVPTTLPEGIGLQPSLRNNLSDEIYRLDLANGTTTFIGSPVDESSMADLAVSEDGSNLFYTDVGTGLLKKMQLK